MVAVYTIVFLGALIIGIMIGLPIAHSLLLSAVSTALAIGGSATNPQSLLLKLMKER